MSFLNFEKKKRNSMQKTILKKEKNRKNSFLKLHMDGFEPRSLKINIMVLTIALYEKKMNFLKLVQNVEFFD